MHYQYYHPNILLLVDRKGNIRRLFTPFRAKSIVQHSSLKLNTIVYIDEVMTNEKDELLFSILGEIYPYNYFKLIIRF